MDTVIVRQMEEGIETGMATFQTVIPSIRLHKKIGFRVVGTREKIT